MKLKTAADIDILREGGKKLAAVVHHVSGLVRPGVSATDLNDAAEKSITSTGGTPAFKGYQGFPAAACISVNQQVVHGIPRTETVLAEGDIVSIDIGLVYQGLYTDMAVTVPVGSVSSDTKNLLSDTQQALQQGIDAAQPGNTIGDIGNAIDRYGQEKGYGVVRQLVGHGVGYAVHEAPQVPNYGHAGTGEKLQPGLVIALEPMFNMGGAGIVTKDDGWTIETADGSLSAHFEHTIVVLEQGSEILTQP